MTYDSLAELVSLEGRTVGPALADGFPDRRMPDGLRSAATPRTNTVWVVLNGTDRFLPRVDIIDVGEVFPGHPLAA